MRDPSDVALMGLRDRARAMMAGDEEEDEMVPHAEPDGDEGARITIIIGGPAADDEDDPLSY
jgi:hypothetical protein